MFKQHRISIMAAVLMAAMSGLPSQSYAASPEQRCTELGANCLCSEPLNTATYTSVPGTNWAWNAVDSVVKECNIEGAVGGAVERNAPFDMFGTSEASIMNALPAGRTNTWVLRGSEGQTGILELGHQLTGSHPTARVAYRWYVYYSPNFQFTTGGCLNSGKWANPGANLGPQMTNQNGSWILYGWTGWTPNLDCCNVAPGADPASVTSFSNFLGKWFRVELIIRNRSGSPGLVFQAYRKNVTDNGPEYKVLDTSIACPDCGVQGWTVASGATTTLTPPGPLTEMFINGFRNGTCAGFNAYSHILVAAWSTDAGQRIGPAAEIEGGAAPIPPAAPAGLTVR